MTVLSSRKNTRRHVARSITLLLQRQNTFVPLNELSFCVHTVPTKSSFQISRQKLPGRTDGTSDSFVLSCNQTVSTYLLIKNFEGCKLQAIFPFISVFPFLTPYKQTAFGPGPLIKMLIQCVSANSLVIINGIYFLHKFCHVLSLLGILTTINSYSKILFQATLSLQSFNGNCLPSSQISAVF